MNTFLVLFPVGWEAPGNRARSDEAMESYIERYGESGAEDRVWDRRAEETSLAQLIGFACQLAGYGAPEDAERAGGNRLETATEDHDRYEAYVDDAAGDGTRYTRSGPFARLGSREARRT